MTDAANTVAGSATGRRWLWQLVALLSLGLSAVVLLVVIGTWRDPTASLHAAVSAALWTTFGPHLLLLSLICIVLSSFGYRFGARGAGILALTAALLSSAGCGYIVARIVAATYAAGGSVNLVSALWLKPMQTTGPDQSRLLSERDGQQLRVAIYQAKAEHNKAPVMLYIHGGGFMTGSNIETDADLRWFADRGWLVFSVDYRLWQQNLATWDLAAQDISCAAAWVAQHAAGFGGNIERLALLGDSAGGNLAINYAYAAAQGRLRSPCGDELPVPQAVIVQYPAVDPLAIYEHGFAVPGFEPKMLLRGYLGGDPYQYPERVQSVSSYSYLTALAPATLIIAPEQDGLVPAWSVYRFADYARLAGVDIELVRLPFASHVYNQLAANSLGNQARLTITARFLAEQGLAPQGQR